MSGSYFEKTPGVSALHLASTFSLPRRDVDLLREIGELHMRIADMASRVLAADRLRDWLVQQPIISTPTICCAGVELERRVAEAEALAEMAKLKGGKQ